MTDGWTVAVVSVVSGAIVVLVVVAIVLRARLTILLRAGGHAVRIRVSRRRSTGSATIRDASSTAGGARAIGSNAEIRDVHVAGDLIADATSGTGRDGEAPNPKS